MSGPDLPPILASEPGYLENALGDLATSTSGRIPCLDGIRALSITLVIVAHGKDTLGYRLPENIGHLLNLGSLGVRVFFVISGFLITTLLLAEIKKYGTISLRHFYFRRTFRIFPAFYAFVVVILVAEAIGWVSLREYDAIHAVTYTTNYHYDRAWHFGHLWSLAVEEQFYLLWPAILLVAGARGGIAIAAAYTLIAPCVRVLTWVYLPESRVGIGETFQTVADSIAIGCVLAAARPWLDKQALFVHLQRRRTTVVGLLIIIFTANHLRGSISISYPIGETVTNVCIALFIDWCLRNPTSRLGSMLNWQPIAYVGVLSYSLYLWQQPFLNRGSDALVSNFPLNIVCMVAAALASYYLIEKPFLKRRVSLGKKWLPRPAVKSRQEDTSPV
ncbi:MAG: acyltransferase [Proteobacteria bacterium]|nr:acyltransferase [Pseudomonadota bacterium]